MEEQEQQLRRKREQLELEAELAASAAKLAILQASDCKSSSQGPSNGMNSYVEKEKRKMERGTSTTPYKQLSMDVRPKETMQQFEIVSKLQRSPIVQQQENNVSGTLHHLQYQPTTTQVKEERTSTHHQQLSQIPPGDLLTIMHRQNEITAALVQQQRSFSLPPRDIPTFDGDPLQYNIFIKAFEQGVEEKAGRADCLYYLEQFTRGQPRELVRSCQHMTPERGYAVAKDLLQEHFGNQYKIVTAYMEKAFAWQTIKSEDVKTLQAYSLFLRGCCNVMEELEYMQEMDMPVNMRVIISKLPFKMREQWRNIPYDIMERTNDRAHFMDLVAFIERRVKILYASVRHRTRSISWCCYHKDSNTVQSPAQEQRAWKCCCHHNDIYAPT